MLPTEDLARHPGMCPDWESNQQAFGSQASTQSTEPQQLGLNFQGVKNLLFQFLLYLYLETKPIIVFQVIILHTGIIIAF